MSPDPRLGTTIADRYRLDRVLGIGGAGTVYAAEHVLIGREVAVKILNTTDRDAIQRFLKEARTTSSIRHPHVVEILDMGETGDGAVYLAMELLEGQPLSAFLKNRVRLDIDEAFQLLLPVMSAVAAVHERGLIHRDLKPANIMLAEVGDHRVPKLLDFGLVKQVGQTSAALTQVGMTIGTPHYMAPEQVEARPDLTPAVDVWAMAVIWYRCLTGKVPFDGPNPIVILNAVQKGQYRPIDELADLPADLAMLVGRCLSLDPKKRPADLQELLEPFRKIGARYSVDLEQAALPGKLEAPPLLPPPIAAPPAPSAPSQRLIFGALGAGVFLVVGAAAVAFGLASPTEAPVLMATAPSLDAAVAEPDAGWVADAEVRIVDVGVVAPVVDAGLRLDAALRLDAGLRLDAEIPDTGMVRDASRSAMILPDEPEPEPEPPPPPVLPDPPELSPAAQKRKQATSQFEEASLARRQGRHPEAIAALDRALALAPDFVAALNSRGLSKQELGDLPGAIADFDRALKLEANNAPILYNRGTAHFAAGNQGAALDDLSRAITLSPNEANYLRQRGQVHLSADAAALARPDFEAAISRDGGAVESRFGLGLALQKLGEDGPALKELDQVLTARPNHSGARYARAQGRARTGDKAGAQQDLEKLLELDPKTKYRTGAEKLLLKLKPKP
jgi:Flp pilus assembly protein TadD